MRQLTKDPNSLFFPRQLLRLTVAYRVPYTIHTLDLASFSGLCHLHIWSLQACKYGRKRPRRFWHLPLSDKRRVEPWEMAPTTIMTFKHMLISSKYIDNNNPHWCCLQTSQPYGYSWQRKCLKILCEAPAPVCLDLFYSPSVHMTRFPRFSPAYWKQPKHWRAANTWEWGHISLI